MTGVGRFDFKLTGAVQCIVGLHYIEVHLIMQQHHEREAEDEDDSGGELDWRIKDRVKTVAAGLIFCLHIGVDPPDLLRTSPCARLEGWTDPLATPPAKSIELIGRNVQAQYEYWQPRARYRLLLDPTVEEVRRVLVGLRKGAKEERVMLHYCGHGVPKPTRGGEMWVFNRQFTQYIPLAFTEIASWMGGGPCMLIFDCSAAGNLHSAFLKIDETITSVYLLSSCGAQETLPMAPEMPADLFTACLTTPMEIAVRWHLYRNGPLCAGASATASAPSQIPGRLNDRKTPLGELNWIFTAITDTIAWMTLPRGLFKRLFRQDILVASIFRNFLLAERILTSFACHPLSHPVLPQTSQHPLWSAWDHVLDACLAQLDRQRTDEQHSSNLSVFQPSNFFNDQMDAFALWIENRALALWRDPLGGEESSSQMTLLRSVGPCTFLPMILQVFLSQQWRSRALELLVQYMDLEDRRTSVGEALDVGVFPYVLKLLQSAAPEIRASLGAIWVRILAYDPSCKLDLLTKESEEGWGYFAKLLLSPKPLESADADELEILVMATIVLALFVRDHPAGSLALLQSETFKGGDLIDRLERHLSMSLPSHLKAAEEDLKVWTCFLLAGLFEQNDSLMIRQKMMDHLLTLLGDASPRVRAASIFCIRQGLYEDENLSKAAIEACLYDGCPIVRGELVALLQKVGISDRQTDDIIANDPSVSGHSRLLTANLSRYLRTRRFAWIAARKSWYTEREALRTKRAVIYAEDINWWERRRKVVHSIDAGMEALSLGDSHTTRFDKEIAVLPVGKPIVQVEFHPFQDFLVAADRDNRLR